MSKGSQIAICFRLTIRNVNNRFREEIEELAEGFRLTIRNVNTIIDVPIEDIKPGFRLTIRNVNAVKNEENVNVPKVLD